MNDEKVYLTFGGAPVKALPDGRLSGRIVTFSSAYDPDRTGEFFTAASDFWLSGAGERRPLLWRHGVDPDVRLRRFGEVQITKAADGLWCSGHFHDRDADTEKLLAMAQGGALNFSTGAVGHLVVTTPVGEAKHIDSWPVAEISLCPKATVAEPRNICTLKSFILQDTTENFHSLPFSQSREHDAYMAEKVRQAKRRAAEIHAHLVIQQYELRMAEIRKRAA